MDIKIKRALLDLPDEWWEYELPYGGTGYVKGSEAEARKRAEKIMGAYVTRVKTNSKPIGLIKIMAAEHEAKNKIRESKSQVGSGAPMKLPAKLHGGGQGG